MVFYRFNNSIIKIIQIPKKSLRNVALFLSFQSRILIVFSYYRICKNNIIKFNKLSYSYIIYILLIYSIFICNGVIEDTKVFIGLVCVYMYYLKFSFSEDEVAWVGWVLRSEKLLPKSSELVVVHLRLALKKRMSLTQVNHNYMYSSVQVTSQFKKNFNIRVLKNSDG